MQHIFNDSSHRLYDHTVIYNYCTMVVVNRIEGPLLMFTPRNFQSVAFFVNFHFGIAGVILHYTNLLLIVISSCLARDSVKTPWPGLITS